MENETLFLTIPAKINLSLDVTGKRENGYHTLRSVFQTVGIYDRMTITKTADKAPFVLKCSDPAIPCDARNLVWKAAAKLFGAEPHGLEITLEKGIPSQAGMGGGSADCAAALLGIRSLLTLALTDAQLLEIGASLGADVPFFLKGGTVLCEGIGEILTPQPALPKRILVIAKGSEGVSTPAAYKMIDALSDPPAPYTDNLLSHLQDDAETLFASCGNIFDAVTDLPEVETIRRVMREHGIRPVLSGSGAAVFGGCRNRAQAKKCAAALSAAGIPFTAVTETVPKGITIKY
ncbi:MAG: 4-(cytidine 5'-diphospho)-2-C-methyl-D-erythritol kinase [Oscillospiraceae bacterium]|nr:4-(cytidine 5'-diphospho)-2-C-methyl-D-erythritol kinase [Oscillospiraceae bacterium]